MPSFKIPKPPAAPEYKRPSEVHDSPCTYCPSMIGDGDPESSDILACGDRGYLLESLFPCAWRPEKLCHGWHGKVMRAVEAIDIEGADPS